MSEEKPFIFDPFDLPVFDVPQKEHLPAAISWDEAMELFDAARRRYMKDFDSPEKRLREKNPESFRWEEEEK